MTVNLQLRRAVHNRFCIYLYLLISAMLLAGRECKNENFAT